jgi:hypothetical protein
MHMQMHAQNKEAPPASRIPSHHITLQRQPSEPCATPLAGPGPEASPPTSL